jgi:hypothetical protein
MISDKKGNNKFLIEEKWKPLGIKIPEVSDWKCYLFSNHGGRGITFWPKKGYVPNFIVRFFMRTLLDCYWVKDKDER